MKKPERPIVEPSFPPEERPILVRLRVKGEIRTLVSPVIYEGELDTVNEGDR